MKFELKSVCYKDTGNAGCKYEKPVVYPIVAILSEKLKKNDDVKIVTIITKGNQELIDKNIQILKNEIDEINKSIGAKISYIQIESDYNESKVNHEIRLKAMLNQMEEDCELYGDITFGPRTVPMVMLCAFAFAEKFFDADIKKIVYGKVEWNKDEAINPELFDITYLHYLNSLTYSMQSDSSEDALKAINSFFNI